MTIQIIGTSLGRSGKAAENAGILSFSLSREGIEMLDPAAQTWRFQPLFQVCSRLFKND